MHRVVIQPDAEAEVESALTFIAQRSPAGAARWFDGLRQAVDTLERFPTRCGVAPESAHFDVEIRQLLYGRGRNKYRILFTIRGSEVHVLHVRHAPRWKL